MAWQPPEEMEEYLESSELCDWDNQEVQRAAKEIIERAETPREAATRIFSFVRDEVLFEMAALDSKASHTLCRRKGCEVNKANLQVALLRAVDIPARYHQVNLKKEYLGGIASWLAYRRILEIIEWHVWCECHLDGKWLACEALFDEALFKGMQQKQVPAARQIPTIAWDGDSDLILISPWVTEDTHRPDGRALRPSGAFRARDHEFEEAQKQCCGTSILAKLLREISVFFSNRRIDGLRQKGTKLTP